jgi:hypothetical protein
MVDRDGSLSLGIGADLNVGKRLVIGIECRNVQGSDPDPNVVFFSATTDEQRRA